MNTKHLKQSLLFSSIFLAITGLTACGGGGDSGGDSGSSSNVKMSGAVVDDYIGYAKVYIDVNNNNEHDSAFEPFAFTDEEGYFSTSKTGTNYCADPKQYEYRYCLEADRTLQTGGVLRVDQGRDLLTTQVYNATMSLLTSGSADGLKITSASSLMSELENVADEDLPTGVTDKETFKEQMQQFFNDYMGGNATPSSAKSLTKAANDVDPNNLDPFDPDAQNADRAFKFVVQTHKVAEAISISFENANSTDTTATESFFMPFAYRAILINLDFSNGGADPYNGFTNKISAILAKVASLSGKSAPSNNSELVAINQNLNCILRPSGDETITNDVGTSYCNQDLSGKGGDNTNNYPTGDSRLEFLKKQLYGSELIAKAANQNSSEFNNTLTVAVTNLGQRLSDTFVVSNRDFEMTQSESKAAGSANSKTLPFNIDFVGKNILLGEQVDDVQFRIYFEENSFVGCQRDDQDVNFIAGNYSIDDARPFLAYLDLLGFTYTIKNVEPADHIYSPTGGQPCQASNGIQSCIAMSYFDLIDNVNKLDFFGNTTALTYLFETTTTAPKNTDDCKTIFGQ